MVSVAVVAHVDAAGLLLFLRRFAGFLDLFLSKCLSGLMVEATHAWISSRHRIFFFSAKNLRMALWILVMLLEVERI